MAYSLSLQLLAFSTHIKCVGDAKADDSSTEVVLSEDGENGCEENDTIPDELESNGEPAIGHDAGVVTNLILVNNSLGFEDEILLFVVGADGGRTLDGFTEV